MRWEKCCRLRWIHELRSFPANLTNLTTVKFINIKDTLISDVFQSMAYKLWHPDINHLYLSDKRSASVSKEQQIWNRLRARLYCAPASMLPCRSRIALIKWLIFLNTPSESLQKWTIYDASIDADAPNQSFTLRVNSHMRFIRGQLLRELFAK